MVKENEEKDDECQLAPELSEKLRHNFRLGDIIWVKQSGSSWWPAQVIDEACVSKKPKKKAKHDALVRLYGTCQYLYIDPWKSNVEFEMMLKQENKSAMQAFHEVLEKELSHVNLPSSFDEEAVNSKATAKTSSSKVRKREGLKRSGRRGAKESATSEGLGDVTEQQYGEERDQEVWSTATTEVSVAKGLRDKTQKHISTARSPKNRKMATGGTSVSREGMRRSARFNAKEYFDAAEDSKSQLGDASEDGTEVWNKASENQSQHKGDSRVDGTWAPDAEIRSMVRDILFSDIIASQHDAEMAYVDDVINGICNAAENISGGGFAAADATKGRQGIKRSGSTVEADSCNVTKKPRKGKLDKSTGNPNEATEDTMPLTDLDNTPECSHSRTGTT